MRDLFRPLAATLRSLARQPGVALPAVLILALGIGANTALFSYVAELYWPRLDAPDPGRVVQVHVGTAAEPRGSAPLPDFLALRERQELFSRLTAYAAFSATVMAGERASFAWGYRTSGDYFPLFAARPAAGRLLLPADDRPGAPRVAVLGHHFWKGTLGADPRVVGRQIRINGAAFTVVGVTAPGFQGHGHTTAVYVPLVHGDAVTGLAQLREPATRWLHLLGRLAPGVGVDQVRAALAGAAPGLDQAVPLPDGPRRLDCTLATAHDPALMEGDPFFTASRILLAAAALFLLLGCASIANLLLARAAARQREWGIRAALGSGRGRLLAAGVADSLLLALAGAALGLPFAVFLTWRIEAYLFTSAVGLAGWSDGNDFLRLDLRTFAFALAASLVAAVAGGLGPALRVARRDLLVPLRTDAAGSAGPAGTLSARRLLVVAQVALSVLLLVGGGLLARTLLRASGTDLGIEPRGLVFATLHLPRSAAGDDDGAAIYARLVEAVRAVPGVTAVGMAHVVPLAGWARSAAVARAERPGEAVATSYNIVGPGYFEAVGIAVRQGRALDGRDRKDAPGAVVASRSLARRLWSEEPAVGRRLVLAAGSAPPGKEGKVYEVVGVADDVLTSVLAPSPQPMLYFAFPQRTHSRMTLVVRGSAPAATVAEGLRRALPSVHGDLSLVEVATGPGVLRDSLLAQRMHAEIAGLFGLLGLGVAAVGLFGLLSYSVTLRRREMGIRLAVGARPGDLLRLVVGQGMALVAAGVGLGIAGALATTRLLASLLHGVGATDPLTFLAAPAGLALIGLLSCYLPARRAARLDPAAVLKGS